MNPALALAVYTLASTASQAFGNLSAETISPTLKRMEYAVRGQVVNAADKISLQLAKDPHRDYPFDHIVYTNIGNPHSVGQKELTWPRQVLALAELPDEAGIDHPDAKRLFPPDAIRRAREIKIGLGNAGTGAYSHSKGARLFREDVAHFIEKRDDGVFSEPDDIFLTNGASAAIETMLKAMIADPSCGVMIPMPQYPIYSAILDLYNGKKVPYFLNEENCWEITMTELERSLEEAKEAGVNIVGFVLINPGNPTGQVLSKRAVQDVVEFCSEHKLVLLSDEVYQENVYGDTSFYSSKRAAHDCGLLGKNGVQLVSFHSVSKGVFGECGRRGGYMELVGFDQTVKDHLYKLVSSNLCSAVSGQIMVSLMVRGPSPEDESFASHEEEKKRIFDSLKHRAEFVQKGLDDIDGISCQPAQGAMYCFPSVDLPDGAKKEAKQRGFSPDTLYALSLLERTGICVVPASGFGQREGRYGFRTTFLPSEEELEIALSAIRQHHEEFCMKYSI
eukprot:scaffold2637_cov153-Cylindrotheca_fusiformis.AAC.8